MVYASDRSVDSDRYSVRKVNSGNETRRLTQCKGREGCTACLHRGSKREILTGGTTYLRRPQWINSVSYAVLQSGPPFEKLVEKNAQG